MASQQSTFQVEILRFAHMVLVGEVHIRANSECGERLCHGEVTMLVHVMLIEVICAVSSRFCGLAIVVLHKHATLSCTYEAFERKTHYVYAEM
jgi:hypothetical protein